ncbi:MAG: glutamate--tRNA ligase [Alphaproteobacteria bacterium]|nr:MAG: glutamate--tRNA ligase [Alphaproteobacteria bacterium]
MTVVTRFPPSPTGFMHVGNARTAIFNWLYARNKGGKFVVRIEDTDRKRHSEEAVAAIMDGLKWLGLDYDGEVLSQFAQRDRHTGVAEEMIAKGQAYYCYCSPEELNDMREKARAEGQKTFYDRRWRDADPTTAPADVKPVVRIKAPLEGQTTIKDKVQGEVSVANDQLDDFIILRSDGTPTYMLSVVVDDHDMGITHIIRGDDHLNNTFRQKVIFDAMGWDVPEFAHAPLIHGADGGKFSKRHGAQSIQEFREMGYLPEALLNYLLRLGWSHGDDEIIPRDKAIEWFNLENIGKAPSKFDFAKLDSLNAHYINESSAEELITQALPFYKERHGMALNDLGKQRITQGIDELKSRAKTLLQFVDESVFYAKSIPLQFDEKALKNLDGAEDILRALKTSFEAADTLDADKVQEICKAIAAEHMNGKLGKVAMPLRAALTGTTVSPSIFHAAEIFGSDEVCNRIQAALDR